MIYWVGEDGVGGDYFEVNLALGTSAVPRGVHPMIAKVFGDRRAEIGVSLQHFANSLGKKLSRRLSTARLEEMAASSRLLTRLQPTRDRGRVADRWAMRNLFFVDFMEILSLVRLDMVELIYFPTLFTVKGKGKPYHGVFTP